MDIEYSLQSRSLLTRPLGWRGPRRVSLHTGAERSSGNHMRDQGRLLLPLGKPTSKSVNVCVIYVNGKKAVRRLRRPFCESPGTTLGLWEEPEIYLKKKNDHSWTPRVHPLPATTGPPPGSMLLMKTSIFPPNRNQVVVQQVWFR